MRKFTVILTRDITESASIEVVAGNEDQAEEKALNADMSSLHFQIDSNVPQRPYVTGIEEVEEKSGDDLCDKCMRSGVEISRTDADGNTICVECDEEEDES